MLKTAHVINLIEMKGLTRKFLSKRCGITVGSFNHALNGRRKLSLAVVMLLAKTLETSVEDISNYGEARAAS